MARLFADPSRLGSDKGEPRHACLCLFSLYKISFSICMWACEVFVDLVDDILCNCERKERVFDVMNEN